MTQLAVPADHCPTSGEQLAAALADLTARGERVMVSGHGSRSSLGALVARPHCTLSTAALDDVVHYEPGDLTITVGAGMPLATLTELLAANDQLLATQTYRRQGTVGGLVASAADGALAAGYGTVRDVVIGAAIAYTDGSLARARGRVVKNVAGYDVPRLMVGSMGTLGVLTEVSFKLQPAAPRSVSLVAGFATPNDALEAATRLMGEPWEPVFVDLLLGACTPQLAFGFDGHRERIDGLVQASQSLLARAGCLGQELLEDAEDLTLRTRLDDPVAHGANGGDALLRWWGRPAELPSTLERLLAPRDDGLIVRLDVRPQLGQVFASLAHSDHAAMYAATTMLLKQLRRTGSAVLLAAPDALRKDANTVWGPPPADFVLMTQVKAALDPDRTLVAGRFVGGL